MAKMTMHQELEMLRKEVEALQQLEAQRKEQEQLQAKKDARAQEQEFAEAREKAAQIMASVESGKTEAREVLDDLLQTIKKDYENLSPTSAIILFALGAAFGRALSSK